MTDQFSQFIHKDWRHSDLAPISKINMYIPLQNSFSRHNTANVQREHYWVPPSCCIWMTSGVTAGWKNEQMDRRINNILAHASQTSPEQLPQWDCSHNNCNQKQCKIHPTLVNYGWTTCFFLPSWSISFLTTLNYDICLEPNRISANILWYIIQSLMLLSNKKTEILQICLFRTNETQNMKQNIALQILYVNGVFQGLSSPWSSTILYSQPQEIKQSVVQYLKGPLRQRDTRGKVKSLRGSGRYWGRRPNCNSTSSPKKLCWIGSHKTWREKCTW